MIPTCPISTSPGHLGSQWQSLPGAVGTAELAGGSHAGWVWDSCLEVPSPAAPHSWLGSPLPSPCRHSHRPDTAPRPPHSSHSGRLLLTAQDRGQPAASVTSERQTARVRGHAVNRLSLVTQRTVLGWGTWVTSGGHSREKESRDGLRTAGSVSHHTLGAPSTVKDRQGAL